MSPADSVPSPSDQHGENGEHRAEHAEPVVPDPGGLVRAARRRADLSQRGLAAEAGMARSTVSRIEAGTLVPSLATLGRLLAVAGLRLVLVDEDGAVVPPMLDVPDGGLLDGADRRYPAHLDVILEPTSGDWWGGRYGLARPPETFHRDREYRDAKRRRSQWEVRVARFRHDPPPPTVDQWLRRHPAHRRPEDRDH
ncbi:MAG: helix-turn-helix domain-containing protein [Pseudonocardia sp.]|nr:helix-turn-helix domain-containing protein [Pseudonocardia sp.]